MFLLVYIKLYIIPFIHKFEEVFYKTTATQNTERDCTKKKTASKQQILQCLCRKFK